MIVVDTNIVAHLLIGGPEAPNARALFAAEPAWAGPLLWRSEFRNLLATLMRLQRVTLAEALKLAAEAEELFAGREFDPVAAEVLQLAGESGCTAYDCEFVAVAEHLDLRLATTDAQILRAFPQRAISLARAATELRV